MINKIQKGLMLDKDEYYKKHLSIINPMFPVQLVKKEIEVLAAFLALDEALVEDDYFNTVARKKVRETLNLTAGNLSNYLRSMITKGFLDKSEISGRITIKEFLIPETEAQGYMFKIVNKG
jgi:DNA-binding MarR family transcriptional regulator